MIETVLVVAGARRASNRSERWRRHLRGGSGRPGCRRAGFRCSLCGHGALLGGARNPDREAAVTVLTGFGDERKQFARGLNADARLLFVMKEYLT